MESKPADGLSLEKFTWKIADISSKLDTKEGNMLKSDCFLIGGYLWRILLGCTKENGVNIVKLTLDVPDSSYFSFGWTRDVKFSLAVIDQIHGTFTIRKEMKYLFNAKEPKYEFSPFINLIELCNPKKGYLVKNICVIEARILVSHIVEPQKSDLFTFMKIVRDKDLLEQIGTYICFDLVDFGKVPRYCVHNQTPFNLFKEAIGNELGFASQFIRCWTWITRRNNTIRPFQPLTGQNESLTIEILKKQPNIGGAEWLFLEVELEMGTRPISLPAKTRQDVLLFFKLYDPEKEELRYAGRLIVNGTAKPIDTVAQINKLVGFSPDEEIELYEEIKFEPDVVCERVSKTVSYFSSQIQDGDIICFQKSHTTDCRFPDVPSFLKYARNRQMQQMVHFVSLKRPEEDEFYLELSKTHSYEEVAERVASRLGLDDPSRIRLTSHNCLTQQPNIDPIRYRSVSNLMGMLVLFNQTSDILYYEVLDIPWPELQDLTSLQVALHHAPRNEVVIHNITMPKNSTVRDLMNQLKSKVQLSHPYAELILLEVSNHKIHKIYPPNENIEILNDEYCRLRAAEIPVERNLGPLDIWIQVCHFFKETSHNQMVINGFGEPFILAIHEGETLVEVKVRIQRKLHVPDKDFRKWKYAFISAGLPEDLKDSDVLSTRFQKKDVFSWDQILGLEHSPNDDAPRKVYAAHQTKEVSSWDQNLGLDNSVNDGPGKDHAADLVDAADYMLEEAEEVPENPISSELVDFKGLAKIDRDFVPLLEEVCSWHPHLIECQQKKSGTYHHWAFTALGRVLHFLKTRKAKDMTENACQHLQVLWEELETSIFELAWLKPHVEHALSMKNYVKKAERMRRLKDSVMASEMKKRKLSAELNVEEVNLEAAKRELKKAEEEDFEERNLDTELGYGSQS